MAEIKFTGNVGKQPELKFTKSGDAYLTFSVADSKSRKLPNGDWETIKEQWLNVTIWRDLAEFYAGKIEKGTRLTVWGEFFERKYETDKGAGVSLDVEAKGIDIFRKRGLDGTFNAAQNVANGLGGQSVGGFTNNPAGGWGAPAEDPWGSPAG